MHMGQDKQDSTNLSGANRRRSGRVMLTVPLHSSGVDANGVKFECSADTISINRHGAHITLDRPLVPGARIRLVNLSRQTEAEFRVVGSLASGKSETAEWGVEATSSEADLWGIHFPAPQDLAPAIAALAECRQCQTVALLQLSEIEAEVLEAEALILRRCPRCESETCWSLAEKTPARGLSTDAPPEKKQERRRVRHFLQRHVTIRDSSGGAERVRTENVSQNGVCCTSNRNYEAGQVVTLSWPHSSADGVFEARARLVRRHDIGGSSRRIYGFEYESPPVLIAPSASAPRRLYWGFCALLAAAGVLAGTAVYSLAGSLASPSRNWTAAAELVSVLLLLYLASLVANAISRAERSVRLERRLHLRRIGTVAVPAFLVIVIICAAAGLQSGTRRARALRFLSDLSLVRALEQHLDAAETRKPVSIQDYSDLCATIQPLAAEWKVPLSRLNDDLRQAGHGGDARGDELHGLDDVVSLEQEKLRVIHSQAALAGRAAEMPASQQLSFWQTNFDPLQAEYESLNARRDALIASLQTAH